MYGGPFGAPVTKWVQKLHFSPVILYRGPFESPVTKWVQKLHFLPDSMYRGPFRAPMQKVGAEIALFAKGGLYQGALRPPFFQKGALRAPL